MRLSALQLRCCSRKQRPPHASSLFLFLFGPEVEAGSGSPQLVSAAANHVFQRSDANTHGANYTSQCHTVGPFFVNYVTHTCSTTLSGFNTAPLGFAANKWLEHLQGRVMDKVRTHRAVILYISARKMSLAQSKSLVGTNCCVMFKDLSIIHTTALP